MSRAVRRGNFANGVYAAEWELFERNPRPSISEPMALADARALVAKYVNDVNVVRLRGSRRGDTHGWFRPKWKGRGSMIALGRSAPKWVVCHEIAHAMNEGRDPGHGAAFRHDYLIVVERELGPWWARRLRAAFRKVGYEA